MSIRTAIITISNSKSRGEGEDTGGAALAAWAEGIGVELVGRDLIPDDRDQIEARLCHWADVEHCELEIGRAHV
jgi:molybdopterin biosynthesis enzyme MoaB